MTRWNEPTATRPNHSGFTLVEMVVSTTMVSVLMLGLGSAMLIAGRALPQAESVTTATAAAAGAAEQMAAELRYATTINQRSATLIEFTVADRNADGLPETIRYEWSGTAGSPLTRRYNAGTTSEMLSNVAEFAMAYDTETISTSIPQANESAETLLIGYTSSTDYDDYAIKDSQWYAEYFRPVLPADTISWKVTRVKFYARQAGALGGEARVQIQRATAGGLPSGIVLDEEILYESILPLLYLQQQMAYTQVSGLSPEQGLCLVFKWVSDAEACKLLGKNRNVTAGNLSLVRSTNRGTTWLGIPGQSLLFSVYGTVTTSGTPQIQNTYYLNAIQIQLRAGNDSQSLVQSAVRTLNRPEVIQ